MLIPDTTRDHPCFTGVYLSPLSHYELCLVSNNAAWPEHFANYLKELEVTPQRLFEELMDRCEPSTSKVFSKLLFLPNRQGQIDDSHNIGWLRELNRETLDADRAKRDIGGWWFNLPLAVYPWMSANLERLLAAYQDESDANDDQNDMAGLSRWNLSSWIHLLENLALGLTTLHKEGAIHGDPRPANIMTAAHTPLEIEPHTFSWIDIGLGYGAKEVSHGVDNLPLEEETTFTPRPLGGGRSTIFYAPEREEAKEFEDADVVSLKPDNKKGLFRLTFYWRPQTHGQKTSVLRLRSGSGSLRELGELKYGDRIQVREFLFEVESVEVDYVLVSRIYEVFLDRVLVEKREEMQEQVLRRLKFASISRYRIFQQWSQATDIYGLGMIGLYIFFNRGLYRLRHSKLADQSNVMTGPTERVGLSSTSIYDRANREKIFHELAILMRNRSFLENILYALKDSKLKSIEELKPEAPEPASNEGNSEVLQGTDPAKTISDVILSTDTNFEIVRQGLNSNNALFARLIYICLRCVWRADEVADIVERARFPFIPFCKSRRMMKADENPSVPAKTAAEELSLLEKAVNTNEGDHVVPLTEEAWKMLGRTREAQVTTLREDLKEAKRVLAETQETNAENMVKAEEELQQCLAARDKLKNVVISTDSSFQEISSSATAMSNAIKEKSAISKALIPWHTPKRLSAKAQLLALASSAQNARDRTREELAKAPYVEVELPGSENSK